MICHFCQKEITEGPYVNHIQVRVGTLRLKNKLVVGYGRETQLLKKDTFMHDICLLKRLEGLPLEVISFHDH
jgi:hypothetical protein